MALVDYSDSDSDHDTASERNDEGTTTSIGLKRKRGGPVYAHGNLSLNEGPTTAPPALERAPLPPALERAPLPRALGRAPLPALPSKFHDLYVSASRLGTSDDPSLHGGRKRVTPHVEGNWPTHIYLEWHPTATEKTQLLTLVSASQQDESLQSLLVSPLGAQLPLHVSLSRPAILTRDQRTPFHDLIHGSISRSGVRPFDVSFTTPSWVPNHEQTRWFLVLRLARPAGDALNRLLRICNRSLAAFGQSPLYETASEPAHPSRERSRARRSSGHRDDTSRPEASIPPPTSAGGDCIQHFHISLAWSLSPPSATAQKALESAAIDTKGAEAMAALAVRFEAVKIKIGNTVSVRPLTGTADGGGAGGLIGL